MTEIVTSRLADGSERMIIGESGRKRKKTHSRLGEGERETERVSEGRNRQWIRVSYRGMKGSKLRETSGAREYLALSYLPENVDDINVDDDGDNVDENEE